MPANPFYASAAWRRLRKAKLAQDPLCQYCGEKAASQVDHALSIENGGDPFAWENLRSACVACHSRKTYYIEVLGRDRVPVKGCRADGTPLDPEHHWNRNTSAQAQAMNIDPEPFKREKNLVGLSDIIRARVEEKS